MYSFQIVAVGKIKGASGYLQAGIDEFLKRLKPYARVGFTEVSEETPTPTVTKEQVLEREGERLLAHVKPGQKLLVLSEHGDRVSSKAFSQRLFGGVSGGANQPNGGTPPLAQDPIIVVVGGPLGLSPGVLERADWIVSLSPMTFPHQLVRLIFLEQVYRALKIFKKEPYHK